jgi:class 3 adenylate cyclase
MGLKQDITDKVKEIIDENFTTEEVSYIPEISNSKLTFANTGLLFEATVLYIDMRDSTKILNKHNKPTIAKIHKAYLHTTVKIATSLGGEVRSFNGDSVLAFFQGTTKNTLSNAVQAAMQIRFMIASPESGINNLLTQYSAVDFGIGLDDGKILCTKVGVGGDNNTKDLIWIGNPINRSVVISDQCKAAEYIGISSLVYNNLNDNVKYGIKKNYLGHDEKVDMWKPYSMMYNGELQTFYKTSWLWSIN